MKYIGLALCVLCLFLAGCGGGTTNTSPTVTREGPMVPAPKLPPPSSVAPVDPTREAPLVPAPKLPPPATEGSKGTHIYD